MTRISVSTYHSGAGSQDFSFFGFRQCLPLWECQHHTGCIQELIQAWFWKAQHLRAKESLSSKGRVVTEERGEEGAIENDGNSRRKCSMQKAGQAE